MNELPFFFFFNDTATTEIYTLSLHDALPISDLRTVIKAALDAMRKNDTSGNVDQRSEEHTSELQSQSNLVCRLLLEKKKNIRCIYLLLESHADFHRYYEVTSEPPLLR